MLPHYACSAARHFVLTIKQADSSGSKAVTVDYWDTRKNRFPLAFAFQHPQVRTSHMRCVHLAASYICE